MVRYNIVSTGSDGNATILEDFVLIDCGVPYKMLEPYVSKLKLVLLTHIHSDHFQKRTIKRLAEERPTLRFGCCRWLAPPLLAAGVPERQIDVLEPRTMYGYGLCNVIPFMLTHNVPNCGYKVHFPSGKVIYATDTNNLNGVQALGYDLYLIEANYRDEDIQAKIEEKKLLDSMPMRCRCSKITCRKQNAMISWREICRRTVCIFLCTFMLTRRKRMVVTAKIEKLEDGKLVLKPDTDISRLWSRNAPAGGSPVG